MRYPEGHKESVREKIIGAASRALRKQGLDGVSIPQLMKRAGLTHGGFYGYFESRDALVAAAIEQASDETAERVFGTESDLDGMLRAYLSPEHVRSPEVGCVIAALGTQARGQPAPVRRAFARGARGLLRLVDAKLRPRTEPDAPSDDALRLASTMVGAVVLARLVDDPELASRILEAARAPAR
jgi:TetR/AcrR family transcriptional repressor of nem operon